MNDAGQAGGAIPGTGEPAFTLMVPAAAPIPVLIAAPHGGRAYPDDVRTAMRDPHYAAMRLEDRHVDALAAEVAAQTGAALLVAHAPRAMLDLNRAGDDMDWSMVAEGAPGAARNSLANRRARSGLGLVPRRLPGLGEVWKCRLARAELDARIDGIHTPYHAALGGALEALRDPWGAALLIDLHSMPPLRPRHPGERAAEFVIGDRFGASSDARLVAHAFRWFAAQGRAVAHNRPYAGGYVLERHAAPARGVHALQLEVCRASYLDAKLESPSARLAGVARLLAGLVRELGAETAALAGGGGLPLAAE
ncbi:MAG: N-formylglutamate amidohydrolase [Tsuneonella sp.]